MIIRSKAAGTGTPGCRRRPARIAAALTALVMTWMVGGGDARADRIVLKSGEVIEGSVIEATRNTVIVLRSIGGMRQMPIQDIQEVQVDLAQGQQIVGELLGWADGVYEVRSGDEVVRVGESGIVSREPRQQTARLLPTRPRGAQQGAAAAAPPSAPAEQSAEPAAPAGPAEQDRIRAAADAASDADAADPKRAAADGAERQGRGTEAQTAAARQDRGGDTEARAAAAPQGQTGDTEARAAAERESQAAATRQSLAAAARQSQPSATEAPAAAEAQAEAAATTQSQAAAAAQEPAEPEPEPQAADAQAPAEAEPQAQARADAETAAESEDQAAADRQTQAAAGEQQAALGDSAILAVKASVDPPAPGARNLVFNIELSQPAKQTVVLIYGTVDGTAKAGEDYEAQQGMVTLAPGARTAEVRVPLIEGAPEDGDKRFELVLMADPKVAEVVDRRVIATVKGAD